jgi:arylsulfatase A-like enzyme
VSRNRAFVALLLAALLSGAGCGSESEKPQTGARNAGINVLLLTIDTLRPDHLGLYGYPRATSPSIDGLASKGITFDLAFTYWPKTRGSFAALFTGLYSSQHGLTVRDRDLPDFNETLAETLRDSGYRTAAALDNANLDASLGYSQGFDEYEETWTDEGSTELERTARITRFGEEFLARPGDGRPFFLWLHYVNPHTPYEPPPELLARFRGDGIVPRGAELEKVVGFQGGVNRKLAIEGETHWGDYIDRYDAEVLAADREIGRILDALEKSPHAGKTIVVLASDHGESLGEHDYFFDHGNDLFNPSLRIPLVVSFPGFLPAGERVPGAVSNLDIFPTILDLAQVSFPPGLQGLSVLPLVRGTKSKLHDELFFENDQHLMGISNGRLKLVHYPEIEGRQEHKELYDMYRDPGEAEDRYRGSESIVAPLEAELSSFHTRTVAWQQETSAKRAGVKSKEDEELSEAARKSLDGLGYVNRPRNENDKKKPPSSEK